MDMGFVRGTKYSHKSETGHLITSLDGFNSYLIIVDKATRYLWVFLSRYKTPPIQTIKSFLDIHGNKTMPQRFLRTDEGGELWGSHLFQQTIKDTGYILEPTASDASFQNELAERQNQTLGDMMRSLLDSTGLGREYWSWGLIHAVYLKNRLPHQATNTTPHEAYTGTKPNIKKLRIFGCPVVCPLPGKQPSKLDTHAATGIFLGYTATENNIYYQDTQTKRIKIATHMMFDEVGYVVPPQARNGVPTVTTERGEPSTIPQLIPEVDKENGTPHILQVTQLTDQGILPTQATPDSAGYDVYSAAKVTIPPHTTAKIPLDIAVTPPAGTYCQLLLRSGLYTKDHLEVKTGTIDRDYTGNVIVVLHNHNNQPYMVNPGQQIAQMVVYKIAQPTPVLVDQLSPTVRDSHDPFHKCMLLSQ